MMRGLLLVNSKNQVTLVEGDVQFRGYLKSILKKDFCLNDSASTSSGVYTDSSFEELPSPSTSESSQWPKRQYHDPSVLSEITHHFLPIVSVFRTAESMRDPYRSMQSGSATILFETLSCGFLLLIITEEDENVARDWLKLSSEALQLHFGPLLESFDADLSVYDQAISQLTATLHSLTGRIPLQKDPHGHRAASYFAPETRRMIPLLKTLTERVSDAIGTNRCLLVARGHFLCSVNSTSDEKKIWKHLHPEDIQALKRHLNLHPLTANTQVNQLWLRSKQSDTPFYADIMRFKVLEEVEIVFVCAASGCGLIRMGAEVLTLLDELIYENSNTVQITTMLKKLCAGLLATTARSHCRTPTAFLRNPPKTAAFIENVWDRIVNEIQNLNPESQQSTVSEARNRSLSLLSMRSAFSMLSMGSSLNTFCGKDKLLPAKLETMIRYLRRQILSLVQELCSSAQADAMSDRLPTAHAVVARSLTRTHLMAIHKLKLNSEDRWQEMKDYLKPTTWRLNMLAFEMVDLKSGITLPYLPENLRGNFDVFPEGPAIMGAIFETAGQNYYGVQAAFCDGSETSSRPNFFGRIKAKKQEPAFLLKVLFDGCIHRDLALRQTHELALKLKEDIFKLRNNFS
ncbi:unnamed protein product, partial [Mesorhabditis spiculigera]